MIIDESGLVRAIKAAYKSDGYCVLNHGEQVTIYTDGWYIRCCWNKLPRKVLATIVEHMGMIPDGNNAFSIEKDGDPQIVMPDIVGQDISQWTGGSNKGTATLVPLMFQGLQIYQEPDGGQCYGVDPAALAIMERMTAEHTTAVVSDCGSLSWQASDELVVVGATRKTSYWVKSWERDVVGRHGGRGPAPQGRSGMNKGAGFEEAGSYGNHPAGRRGGAAANIGF